MHGGYSQQLLRTGRIRARDQQQVMSPSVRNDLIRNIGFGEGAWFGTGAHGRATVDHGRRTAPRDGTHCGAGIGPDGNRRPDAKLR